MKEVVVNTRLIKTSKVAFDILFWLGVVALIGLLVVAAVVPALAEGAVESGDVLSGEFMGANIDVSLDELDVSQATQFGWALVVSIISGLAVSTYVAHQVRRALRAILDGKAFRSENHGRLQRIAYATFVLVPVGIVTQTWMDSVVHGGFQLSVDLPLGTIAIGLLALSIAEIYKAGISLQDEAELTV